MTSASDIGKAIRILIAGYPYFTPSPDTIRVYTIMLQDLDPDILVEVIKLHLATNKFFPSVAELREEYAKIIERASRTPTPIEAWGEVVRQMERTGSYRRPTFSNPLIEKVVNYMGWETLCLSENPVADRAHFMKAYETVLNREREDLVMLPETRETIKALGEARSNQALLETGD
jgi:hypothetical protein